MKKLLFFSCFIFFFVAIPKAQAANNASCQGYGSTPSSVVAGSTFTGTVIMKNTGTVVWDKKEPSPHRLGTQNPQDNTRWNVFRVDFSGATVELTKTGIFTFTARAPTTPGSYPFDWKMLEVNVEWFGATCTKTITVTAVPTSTPTATPTPGPITITGRVYDERSGNGFGGVMVDVPGFAPFPTNADGSFSFSLRTGDSFYVRTKPGDWLPPGGGYAYPTSRSYEWQVAGVNCRAIPRPPGCDKQQALYDRASDTGYFFPYKPYVTVTGKVFEINNEEQEIPISTTVLTCRDGQPSPEVASVVSDATTGMLSFVVPYKETYCIRTVPEQRPGLTGPFINGTTQTRDWARTYEWQVAGWDCASQGSCEGDRMIWDRDTDTNADFRYQTPLSVTLTANPDRGIGSVNSQLTASADGGGNGSFNYNFWWHCVNTSSDLGIINKSIAEGGCGVLSTPSPGQCLETYAVGYKCDGINQDTQSTPYHFYNTEGTYTPKVIVERGNDTKQSQATITVSPNGAPTAANATAVVPLDFCANGPDLHVAWIYSDPDDVPPGTDPQTKYEIQISENSDFSPLIGDPIIAYSNSTNRTITLGWGRQYYVRVKVTDSLGLDSAFATTSPPPRFPLHAYPAVDFSWDPPEPHVDEVTDFKDKTEFFGGAGGSDWFWTWADCSGSACEQASSTEPNPSNEFHAPDTYIATLRVTDTDGYACTTSRNINVDDTTIPRWFEVPAL